LPDDIGLLPEGGLPSSGGGKQATELGHQLHHTRASTMEAFGEQQIP